MCFYYQDTFYETMYTTQQMFFAFTFLINYKNILSANIPANPCPKIFQYVLQENRIYGRIIIPNDYSGNYHIEVRVSYADNVNSVSVEFLHKPTLQKSLCRILN